MKRALPITLLLIGIGLTAHAREVEELRVWAGPEYTRTVLDVSQPVDYRIFTLEDPPRVVVDIRQVRLDRPLGMPGDSRGLLRDVRTGIRDGTDLRVVFDVAGPVQPKSFLLPPAEQYGHRLVVDLYPRDAAPRPVKTVETLEADGPRDVIIAIDAGHGGEDPGATGPRGTREKQVVLEISRRVAKLVDEVPGMKAVLIRDGDYYLPLVERFQKARQHRADLFVSIHADAFYDRSVRGSSVFVLSKRGATSQAAKWLAARENESDLVGGVKLSDKDELLAKVLLDLSQSATLEASESVARNLVDGLAALGPMHKRQVERANFVVLRSPDVPSVLVETAFISNPDEERRLGDFGHQQRLASAVVAGLASYFEKHAPPGTLIARNGIPYQTHVVHRGDTLSEIAARYNVSLNSLRAANQLDTDLLYVGAVLKIPPS